MPPRKRKAAAPAAASRAPPAAPTPPTSTPPPAPSPASSAPVFYNHLPHLPLPSLTRADALMTAGEVDELLREYMCERGFLVKRNTKIKSAQRFALDCMTKGCPFTVVLRWVELTSDGRGGTVDAADGSIFSKTKPGPRRKLQKVDKGKDVAREAEADMAEGVPETRPPVETLLRRRASRAAGRPSNGDANGHGESSSSADLAALCVPLTKWTGWAYVGIPPAHSHDRMTQCNSLVGVPNLFLSGYEGTKETEMEIVRLLEGMLGKMGQYVRQTLRQRLEREWIRSQAPPPEPLPEVTHSAPPEVEPEELADQAKPDQSAGRRRSARAVRLSARFVSPETEEGSDVSGESEVDWQLGEVDSEDVASDAENGHESGSE